MPESRTVYDYLYMFTNPKKEEGGRDSGPPSFRTLVLKGRGIALDQLSANYYYFSSAANAPTTLEWVSLVELVVTGIEFFQQLRLEMHS